MPTIFYINIVLNIIFRKKIHILDYNEYFLLYVNLVFDILTLKLVRCTVRWIECYNQMFLNTLGFESK